MKSVSIINNVTETVKDNLIVSIKNNSKIAIAASCFSIYAFQELKKQLNMSGYYSIKANSENASKKIAFEHQNNAFKEINKVFTFPINNYKGTKLSI